MLPPALRLIRTSAGRRRSPWMRIARPRPASSRRLHDARRNRKRRPQAWRRRCAISKVPCRDWRLWSATRVHDSRGRRSMGIGRILMRALTSARHQPSRFPRCGTRGAKRMPLRGPRKMTPWRRWRKALPRDASPAPQGASSRRTEPLRRPQPHRHQHRMLRRRRKRMRRAWPAAPRRRPSALPPRRKASVKSGNRWRPSGRG